MQSADPQIVKLKAAAKQVLDAGDYAKAESLLEDIAKHYSTAAAEAPADNARLQRVQLRYAKAAAYWQKAAALLPEDKKKERTDHLNEAGYDLHRITRYSAALPLWEQSLTMRREIGDRAGEAITLNNFATIAYAEGDYTSALTYLAQSLKIQREIGDREGKGTTLGNIGALYHARCDYAIALKYLEQSLTIRREIGDREGKGTTLGNIGALYHAQCDYAIALKYLEQSLTIRREIGDREGEGSTLNNISQIYKAWSDDTTALTYLEQSLTIRREISDKTGEGMRWATWVRFMRHGVITPQLCTYMSRV